MEFTAMARPEDRSYSQSTGANGRRQLAGRLPRDTYKFAFRKNRRRASAVVQRPDVAVRMLGSRRISCRVESFPVSLLEPGARTKSVQEKALVQVKVRKRRWTTPAVQAESKPMRLPRWRARRQPPRRRLQRNVMAIIPLLPNA